MVFCPFFQDLTGKTGLHPIMADVTVRIKNMRVVTVRCFVANMRSEKMCVVRIKVCYSVSGLSIRLLRRA